MADEIFDVVNERDEVIEQLPRDEVHRRKLNHRAIHLLVFNSAGELFLQKRSMKKDQFPGVWDSSVSGHLDTGESYDACVLRESMEEISLPLETVPEKLFKIDSCDETGQEFVWVYRCEAEGPFELHPEEIETGGWFAPAAITQWILEKPDDFAPALALIWRHYIAL